LAKKPLDVIFAVLYRKCRVGQGVKTPPFHGGITGSNPVRGTRDKSFVIRKILSILERIFYLGLLTAILSFSICRGFSLQDCLPEKAGLAQDPRTNLHRAFHFNPQPLSHKFFFNFFNSKQNLANPGNQ
jgi:hypothetical protein